ncbi:MAG: PAS domain S-box protein [Opitutales bacterium]|nr:PAS domain S-box protein [Opitutales bacterium]
MSTAPSLSRGSKPRLIRLFLAFSVVLLIAGMAVAWACAAGANREMRDRLTRDARLMAASLPAEKLKDLTGTPADLESPFFRRIKRQIEDLGEADPRHRFLYVMGRNEDGLIFFYVDNEPFDSPDASLPGDTFEEAPDRAHRAFLENRVFIDGPVRDRWGTWLTAWVPLSDDVDTLPVAGQTARYVLGLDIAAGDWYEVLWRAAAPALLLTVVLQGVLLGLLFYFSHTTQPTSSTALLLTPVALGTLVFGVGLALLATLLSDARESSTREGVFAQLAMSQTETVVRALKRLRDSDLEALGQFFEHSEAVAFDEFHGFTRFLQNRPHVIAWVWAPRVEAGERAAFEDLFRREGQPSAEIWNESPAGTRFRSPDRPVYFPVRFSSASSDLLRVQSLGYDFASEPLRRAAIEEALSTGLATASRPVGLVLSPQSSFGLRIFRPVPSGSAVSDPLGCVVAVISLPELLARDPSMLDTRLAISFRDDDGEWRTVAASGNAADDGGPLRFQRPLAAFGQVFLFSAEAGPEFLGLHPRRAGMQTLLLGLSLAIAVALLVGHISREQAWLEETVVARTTALAERTADLDHFFELGLDLFCIVSRDGRFLRLNSEWEEVLGYRADEMQGRALSDFLHPEDRLAVTAALSSGNADAGRLSFEKRFVCRDGTERWLEWRSFPQGETIFAAARDVTERRAMQAALAAERDLLSRILDSGIAAFVVMNADQRVIYANSEAAHLLGIPQSSMDGRAIENDNWHLQTLDGQPLPEESRVFSRVLATGRPVFDVRYRLVWPDGRNRILSVNAAPIEGSEAIPGRVVCALRDVSDEVKAARELADARVAAEDANAAKSAFLANMSHEIRTPMNGVLGMTELLLETALSDEQRHYAHMLRESGLNMLSLLNDILDLSKIEAGRLEFEAEDFDVREVVEAVVFNLRTVADGNGLKLQAEIDPDVPAQVHGDPRRVRQILLNLMGNAIKFTRAGRVSVAVGLVCAEGGKVTLRLRVRDTGMGIPAEKQHLLFRKFSQIGSPATREIGGTGLGLAIVKELTTRMGGGVEVRSPVYPENVGCRSDEEGPGAEFVCTLVLGRVENVPSTHPLEAPSPKRVPAEVPAEFRVLVVEDNTINQMVARELLARLGLTSDIAGDARAADRALAANTYDLVLLDIQLPGEDGYSIARRIRRDREGLGHRDVPIVAITANVMSGERERCLDAGMNDFLAKPLRIDQLREVVMKWLRS